MQMLSYNAPFRAEMWAFLFLMEYCGIWNSMEFHETARVNIMTFPVGPCILITESFEVWKAVRYAI